MMKCERLLLLNEFLCHLRLAKPPALVFEKTTREFALAKMWLNYLGSIKCDSALEKKKRNILICKLVLCLDQGILHGVFLKEPLPLRLYKIRDDNVPRNCIHCRCNNFEWRNFDQTLMLPETAQIEANEIQKRPLKEMRESDVWVTAFENMASNIASLEETAVDQLEEMQKCLEELENSAEAKCVPPIERKYRSTHRFYSEILEEKEADHMRKVRMLKQSEPSFLTRSSSGSSSQQKSKENKFLSKSETTSNFSSSAKAEDDKSLTSFEESSGKFSLNSSLKPKKIEEENLEGDSKQILEKLNWEMRGLGVRHRIFLKKYFRALIEKKKTNPEVVLPTSLKDILAVPILELLETLKDYETQKNIEGSEYTSSFLESLQDSVLEPNPKQSNSRSAQTSPSLTNKTSDFERSDHFSEARNNFLLTADLIICRNEDHNEQYRLLLGSAEKPNAKKTPRQKGAKKQQKQHPSFRNYESFSEDQSDKKNSEKSESESGKYLNVNYMRASPIVEYPTSKSSNQKLISSSSKVHVEEVVEESPKTKIKSPKLKHKVKVRKYSHLYKRNRMYLNSVMDSKDKTLSETDQEEFLKKFNEEMQNICLRHRVFLKKYLRGLFKMKEKNPDVVIPSNMKELLATPFMSFVETLREIDRLEGRGHLEESKSSILRKIVKDSTPQPSICCMSPHCSTGPKPKHESIGTRLARSCFWHKDPQQAT